MNPGRGSNGESRMNPPIEPRIRILNLVQVAGTLLIRSDSGRVASSSSTMARLAKLVRFAGYH